jgi:IS5 family transposase
VDALSPRSARAVLCQAGGSPQGRRPRGWKTPSTIQALQSFARIELDAEGVSVPDATTLLKFRRLLETHDLCKTLFVAINADLAERGLVLREGTRVDATLIGRALLDQELPQATRPRDAPDQEGQPMEFWNESAHRSGPERQADAHRRRHRGERGRHHPDRAAAARPGERGACRGRLLPAWTKVRRSSRPPARSLADRMQARLFEHPFHIVENLFGYRKTRCRGLAKTGTNPTHSVLWAM